MMAARNIANPYIASGVVKDDLTVFRRSGPTPDAVKSTMTFPRRGDVSSHMSQCWAQASFKIGRKLTLLYHAGKTDPSDFVNGFWNAGPSNVNNDTIPNQIQEAKKSAKHVAPVVIRQVLHCRNDDLKIWGTNIEILCIIARIKNIKMQSSKVIYTIQDLTGQMRVVYWIPTDGNNIITPKVHVNDYIQIYGTIVHINGDKLLRAFKLEAISDVNAITFHYLHCIKNRFKAESSSKMKNSNEDYLPSTLSPQETMVFNLVKGSTSKEGISKNIMYASLKNCMTPMQVGKIVENLCNMGCIYSTVDENHFKPT